MKISYNENRYHLEKYSGRGTRHECPQCHDKRSFTFYVDESGAILDPFVGRCNHESACGYHYKPRQYFVDHPQLAGSTSPAKPRQHIPVLPPPREPDFIAPDLVGRSRSTKSDFYNYLSTLISSKTLDRVWRDYHIGATRDGGVIFWQIDCNNRVRTGKVMRYNPETGHRLKGYNETGIDWIHAILKRRSAVSEDFNLVQCLFGEHLLNRFPEKAVALVESEKTAIVGACVFPQYVWLATGGKSQMSPDKMNVLAGRQVLAFPDVDGFNDWTEKAKELAKHGIFIQIMDLLERKATAEDRAAKIDIADWILRELAVHPEKELILQRLIERVPGMEQFIKDFDLVLV